MSDAAWDVAVVGGGPAGSSAAITLARRGLRVVMFEAKAYPHDKLCGEFLSPECAGMLSALGLSDRMAALEPVAIKKVTLTAPDGSAWEAGFPSAAMGLSRRALDQALAERVRESGGLVREATQVTGITGSLKEGFEISVSDSRQTIYRARAVIAAHGKRAAFDRVLDRSFLRQRHPFMAIKAHFNGPPIPGRVELHVFPGGYCGLSEIEGGAKVVCLLVSEETFRRRHAGAGLDGFMDWMKSQNIFLQSWLHWAERIHEHWITIAQVPFTRKPLFEGDVLMAGDAACLIAPLAGNGISMALEGGMLAAHYLEQYFSGCMDAAALHHRYPRAWERRFSLRLALARALQAVMFHPQAASRALGLLNAFPGLGRLLIRGTRGSGMPIQDSD